MSSHNRKEGGDMLEAGENQTKDAVQPGRRSSRPPRPLTHRLDLRTEYFKAGLRREELGTQSQDRRRDKTHTTTATTPVAHNKSSRRKIMDTNTENVVARKPATPGTSPVRAVDHGAVSYVDCAKAGGTLVLASVLIMGAWKGLNKWLG